jgi:hypothetical protein
MEMLHINVQPVDFPDDVPSNLEIREVVKELQNKQAARATGLQAEHIKVRLQDVVHEEKETTNVGCGGFKWHIFVKLMQSFWEHGCLP